MFLYVSGFLATGARCLPERFFAQEGFLTGSLATRNSEHVDDSSDERVKTQELFICM